MRPLRLHKMHGNHRMNCLAKFSCNEQLSLDSRAEQFEQREKSMAGQTKPWTANEHRSHCVKPKFSVLPKPRACMNCTRRYNSTFLSNPSPLFINGTSCKDFPTNVSLFGLNKMDVSVDIFARKLVWTQREMVTQKWHFMGK